MFKNLLKYTIGLPFLIIFTLSLIAMGILILICELLGEFVGFIIEGNCCFNYLCGIDMISTALEIWKPIE